MEVERHLKKLIKIVLFFFIKCKCYFKKKSPHAFVFKHKRISIMKTLGVFGMVMDMTMSICLVLAEEICCCEQVRHAAAVQYSIHELPVADLYRWSWERWSVSESTLQTATANAVQVFEG